MNLKEENEKLRELLSLHESWLRAYLNCEAFSWDADQHEAAYWCVDEAKKFLENHPTEPAPAQDEREPVVTVACIDLSTDAGVVLYANRDHWLDNELLMTVAQHERIVAALNRSHRADRSA